jgi:hypothetical protein
MPVREDHQELLIVKGVAAAKGDSSSAEIGLVSINLLADEGEPGWSLDAEDGWSPKRAQLKGGGTWADSAVSPGRTLVAGEDGNVIETLQLTVTGTSILDLGAQLTRMGRMRQAVIDFWTNPREIDPVYLHWYAKAGAGPQFALIYAMDIAELEPDVWQNPIRDVTITIEREPYWRGLPPGANPKVWTHTQIRHVNNYTPDDLTLYTTGPTSDVNHAVSGTVPNNDRSPNNNYLEITADKIPGDAPALLELACALSTAASPNEYYIGVRSEPFSYNGMSNPFICTLDASAFSGGTDVATAADATTASGNRVNITPGTASDSPRGSASVYVPSYQGRFAVFLRAYQSGGAAGDWRAHIEVFAAAGILTDVNVDVLPEVQFEVGATHWPPVYMGEIQIPAGMEAGVSSLGLGLKETQYFITIYARRTTGVSTLRFADMVLMPIDDGFARITANFDTAKSSDVIIDNTGYMAHGKPGDYAVPFPSGGTNVQYGVAEVAGQPLVLQPRKTNRIYFIRTLADVATGAPAPNGFAVRGNLIPRWVGIRSE